MYPNVVLAALLALVGGVSAVAVQHHHGLQHEHVQHKSPPIPILKQYFEQSKEGYKFSYETGNGIHAEETGHIKHLGDKKHETIVQKGSVTYHDEHGHPITLTYVADEHGFQPQGAHLPTPPPVPHEVQKSIEQHQVAHQAVISHHQAINAHHQAINAHHEELNAHQEVHAHQPLFAHHGVLAHHQAVLSHQDEEAHQHVGGEEYNHHQYGHY